MRIDALNQVSQLYKNNKTKETSKVSRTSKSDKVEISDFGRELQVAKQAISETTDFREDKVKAIKERMDNGTYDVSMSDLCDKLLGK